MRLTERICLVGSGRLGFSLTNSYDCHVYLIDCGVSLALIDTGAGLESERIEEEIRRDGHAPERISHVLLTHGHADHSGGAAHFHDRHGARIVASTEVAGFLRAGDETAISLDLARQAGAYPADYHWATCPVDATLSDGEILPIGDLAFQALETPGHAIGHLSFLLPRPEGDVLFSGDSVFHGGKILLQAIPDCSLWDYRRSIARLRTLRVTTLLPGHQALVMREGQQHIAAAERAFAILLPPPNLV